MASSQLWTDGNLRTASSWLLIVAFVTGIFASSLAKFCWRAAEKDFLDPFSLITSLLIFLMIRTWSLGTVGVTFVFWGPGLVSWEVVRVVISVLVCSDSLSVISAAIFSVLWKACLLILIASVKADHARFIAQTARIVVI